jgi:hypothetical protein
VWSTLLAHASSSTDANSLGKVCRASRDAQKDPTAIAAYLFHRLGKERHLVVKSMTLTDVVCRQRVVALLLQNCTLAAAKEALYIAAKNGDLFTMRVIMQTQPHNHNLDANTSLSLYNDTALTIAARWGHVGVVRYLFDLGTVVDSRTLSKMLVQVMTNTRNVGTSRQLDTVIELLKRGADPDSSVSTSFGDAIPVWRLALKENPDAVPLLLTANAKKKMQTTSSSARGVE